MIKPVKEMTHKEYWSQDWTKHWIAPYVWMSIGGLITIIVYLVL